MPQVVNNAPSKVSEVMAIPWRSEDEDRSTLEDEIAVIPQPAFIKPLAIQPDQSISPDMVIHRLADITDGEKYTVFVGHEQKKIQNVVPSTSGLALVLEGGMLGLSGAQKAELYWEDVKAIHCSELITQKKGNLYQCSLLISASKKPMTFQCSTESDCAHLVSALEYWLRPTHGGKDVPITGMPYLTQGLRTMDNITVATIWADSPADKAGLKLGDIVWSLDTNPDSWVGKDSMERELQALSYGRHILYAVPAADWAKAKDEQLRDPSATFNPTRKGLVIKVSEGKPGQN
jgi:hypothetical protein